MKFNIKALALTCGIVWGLSICLMTLWILCIGDGYNAFLESFEPFYFGYKISYLGSVIGLAYGFVDGAVGGLVFGWLYNRLS